MINFGKRTAINSRIQGTGADIIKISMVKVWQYQKEVTPGEVFMVTTMHDELNFSVDKTNAVKHINKFKELMEFPIKGWKVPLSVDVEIGNSWGETFKFKRQDTGEWVPDFKE